MLLNRSRFANFSIINPKTVGRNLPSMSDLSKHLKKPIRMGEVDVNGLAMVKRVEPQWVYDPNFPNARIRKTSYRLKNP